MRGQESFPGMEVPPKTAANLVKTGMGGGWREEGWSVSFTFMLELTQYLT